MYPNQISSKWQVQQLFLKLCLGQTQIYSALFWSLFVTVIGSSAPKPRRTAMPAFPKFRRSRPESPSGYWARRLL